MIRVRGPLGRLGLLGALYLVQGLPFGFQAKALPVYLRAQGVSLEAIGLLSALALPWLLKALWAPLVDRLALPGLGRRKSWILPMQAGMALSCLAAATVASPEQVQPLLVLVLLMNLFAATQDVAVDGWAVELLGDQELGPGNAAQVVGYKVGMLLGGGLLVWATAWVGWRGLFLAMAGLIAAVGVLVALVREEPAPAAAPTTVAETLAGLRSALTAPGTATLLLFVGTYKLGETLIDAMYRPFLVDAGFAPATLGLWLGTWGMVASLLGSALGGLAVLRLGLVRALGVAAALRLLPEVAQVGLALRAGPLPSVEPALPAGWVVGVSCAEEALGGLLTTTLFAWMMSRVDRGVGGSHFTVLASVEVLGKLAASSASGLLAVRLGYGGVFALGTVLGVGTLLLVVPVSRLAARDGQGTVRGA